MQFELYDKASAPEGSKSLLDTVNDAFGFVPNLAGVLAEAPAALRAYLAVHESFQASSFTPQEQQVVLLATAAENECHYCVAAHSTVAGMVKLPSEHLEALRSGAPIPDARLEALRRFTTAVVRARGWVDDEEVKAFLDAGYTRAQVLEAIVGITQKTLSNYVNHIAGTPLDDAFAPQAWEPVSAR